MPGRSRLLNLEIQSIPGVDDAKFEMDMEGFVTTRSPSGWLEVLFSGVPKNQRLYVFPTCQLKPS